MKARRKKLGGPLRSSAPPPPTAIVTVSVRTPVQRCALCGGAGHTSASCPRIVPPPAIAPAAAEVHDAHGVRHVVHPEAFGRTQGLSVTMLHRSVAAVDAIEGRETAEVEATIGTCSGCAFWKADGELYRRGQEPMGPCRRKAPERGTVNVFGLPDRKWPIMLASDACGEYRKKGT